MKTLLTTLLLALSIQSFGQLDNHILYKVEHDGVITVNGTTAALLFLLGNFGAETPSDNPFTGGVAYVADLNSDGVVNTGDLTTLMGAYGQTIWDQSFECEDTLYNCFLLSFPTLYWGTSWFPSQPFIGINTALGTYWWVEY